MPDYENDLAFKPAMTWEELKQKYGTKFDEPYFISKKLSKKITITFWKDKSIFVYFKEPSTMQCGFKLADNISYERMKNIIDNLYGED